MKRSMIKWITFFLLAILIAGLCLIDVSGQAQRRRRRKKSTTQQITNPAIAQPSPGQGENDAEPRVVGGAEEQPSTRPQSAVRQAVPGATPEEDPEMMRRTIRNLSTQVDKLTDKIGQMEEQQRSLLDLERLSRAEQRSETLRAQLRDVQAKQGELQTHLVDLDFALKPENIERAASGYGTTRPEELREQRRKQLEAERNRSQTQLEQLADSQRHLEEAIATSDTEIEKLRQRIDAADAAAIENSKRKPATESAPPAVPVVTPTPSPTPIPPA